jgi:ubiquinone/menaquinone biosynthesis C-methylase UbiE
MTTPADDLQKVFKTLSDPTRVRILRLLEAESLVVQELMQVLGMAQSRVSRHLGILRDLGLVSDHRDGTYVAYRFQAPPLGIWRETWDLISKTIEHDPSTKRDAASLERVIEARSNRTRTFFDAVGPEWDALRKVFNDDVLRARAINRLVSPGQCIVDVGTGTGILALEMARLGLRVVGVDSSEPMLKAAQAKSDAAGLSETHIDFRQGDASHLPLEDGEADGALAHMVLHSVASPADVIRDMARVVKPGGSVVAVDFLEHQQEWMRDELGVLWLGFSLEDVRSWFRAAGLSEPETEHHDPANRGRDLPGTFTASARRPIR